MVTDCTDTHEDTKPEWQPRKEAYIAILGHKLARSLAVSLADKTHNASAFNADLREHGSEVWERFTVHSPMLSNAMHPARPPIASGEK